MKRLQFIGYTIDNVPVYDRPNSHLQEHPIDLPILREALKKVSQKEEFKIHVIDMEKVIRVTTCVPVTPSDDIIYVIKKNRSGPTPMVLGRKPIKCKKFILVLKRIENGFVLITAFIGEETKPEPWDPKIQKDPKELSEATKFWREHALIYDESVVALKLGSA